MSIVTYYARMSLPQLEQLRADPQGLAALYANPPAGGELLDLDKASDTISWLLSPCKRAEQLHYAAQMAKVMNDAQYDANTLPPIPPLDDFAIAVEGRGPNKDRRLGLGPGPACIF